MSWLYAIFLGWLTAILVTVFVPIGAPRDGIFTWKQVLFRIGLTIGAVLAWRLVFLVAALMVSGPGTDRSHASASSGTESQQRR